MSIRRLLPILFVVIFAVGGDFVFAYDDKTTHPALTQEIIELYNLHYPDRQITSEEREWIIAGSIQEDIPPRMINHFYDPVYNTGWTGANAGTVSPEAMRRWSSIGAAIERPLSALEWVRDYNLQQSFVLWGGNRSWRRGMEYFADGNRKEFYLTLGHILHLLEDMGVPDHTRDDTHISVFGGIGGDSGSPYENYASRWTRDSIKQLNLIESLKDIGPPVFRSVEDYLKSLARYSNRYFFSKDTINDHKYVSPKIVREDANFGFGIDEREVEFPLVIVEMERGDNSNLSISYSLRERDEYKPILDSYFYRLARQILLHGVGMVELYLREAEDYKFNTTFECQAYASRCVMIEKVAKPVAKATTIPNLAILGFLSFGGELHDVSEGAKNFVTPVTSAVSNVFKNIFNVVISPVKNVASKVGVRDDLFRPTEEQTQMVVAPLAQEEDAIAEGSPGAEEYENFAESSGADIDNGASEYNPSAAELSRLQAQINEAAKRVEDLRRRVAAVAGQTRIAAWGQSEEREEEEELEPEVAERLLYDAPYKGAAGSGSSGGGDGSSSNASFSGSSSTGSSTVAAIPDTSNVSHVVISEVQVAGVDAGDEFIELYNPADQGIDVSDWSIQYLSGSADSAAQAIKKNFESGSAIGARSYFLIARGLNASGTDGYTGNRVPDLSHRTFSLSGAANGATIFLVRNQEIISGADDIDIVDRLAYGSGDGLLAESAAAPLPATGQSLERKAWISGACVSASGANEFSGNGCDTDNNANDFEIRFAPYPQNLANLPETRYAPQILNLSVSYSSSTMSADFSWTLSADARGATSTNIYTISKITSTSTVQLISASSTESFSTPVSEDTAFEFKAQDWEGAFRHATATISSSFYSYFGTVFEQSADTEALTATPPAGPWFAQVFTPQRTGRVNSASIYLEGILGGLDGADFCSLSVYRTADPLSTSTDNFVGGTGMLTGPPCASNTFSIATTTISAGTTYTLVFSYSEFNRSFNVRGTGDVIPGSYWSENAERPSKDIKFSLSGIVTSPVMFTEPPSQPQNLQTNFDRFNLELDLSWNAAADSDSGFHYQINYTTSTELSATGWRSVGTSTAASIPLVYPNTYKVGVRARDDFYNVSASTVSDWSFPAGFSTTDSLAGQLDTNYGNIENGQDGRVLNEFAQTFTAAAASVPYSIRLNTAKTANGFCSVKIYAADSISGANSGNLIATTGDLGGAGNNACDASSSKTFQFSSTGILNAGTTYIWIYTARNGSANGDAVVAGFKAEGYPGVLYNRLTQNGSVLWTTTQPQTINAYFELFGDLQ